MLRYIALVGLVACAGNAANDDARGALYGVTLEECNRTATTLCESIACENRARAANGRMPRALPPSCNGKGVNTAGDASTGDASIKDGGTDGR